MRNIFTTSSRAEMTKDKQLFVRGLQSQEKEMETDKDYPVEFSMTFDGDHCFIETIDPEREEAYTHIKLSVGTLLDYLRKNENLYDELYLLMNGKRLLGKIKERYDKIEKLSQEEKEGMCEGSETLRSYQKEIDSHFKSKEG